jgi:hypothetical protein
MVETFARPSSIDCGVVSTDARQTLQRRDSRLWRHGGDTSTL